jgi:hypothetical protein
MMWFVNLAIYVVLIAATIIVGAVAAIVAGISWLYNWVRTRDDRLHAPPESPARYSDRR